MSLKTPRFRNAEATQRMLRQIARMIDDNQERRRTLSLGTATALVY